MRKWGDGIFWGSGLDPRAGRLGWTPSNCKRWGRLIERMYGVRFGLTQIRCLLGRLGFSAQKPERCAIERV